MTPATLTSLSGTDKPTNVPPRQPLPRPVYDATKPALKLGPAMDLWRWRTGRCTLAELGWMPA